MDTRERLIKLGHIRPATNRTSSGLTWTRADRTVRQSLIDKGYVRPQGLFVEPNAPMAAVMRAFMIRVSGR